MTNEEKLRKIVAEQLSIHESEIKLESVLNELGADSMDRIELGLAISDDEEHGGFNKELPDRVIDSVVTFGDLLKNVEEFGK